MKLPGSWLGVPMLIGKRLVGVICVQAYRTHAYSEEDQRLLSTIADQIAVAVEQARLYQTLRESEERYRTLFEQANDAVFLQTLEGRILDVNERACELLGYTREELQMLTVADIVPPEKRETLPQIIRQEMTEGGGRIEAQNVRKDGSRVAVEVSTALLDVGGQSLVLALVRDVTERHEAERALRDSEVKHRLLLSSIRSPVLAVDGEMTIVYCNDAYGLFVGRSAAELEGENLLSIFPEFAKLESYAAYLEVLETGEPARAEGQLGDRHLRSWVFPTPWGILAVGEDITERKRAEEAVAERQQYLEGVLASAPDAIVTLDARNRIVEWNQGAERLFGYERGEVIGHDLDGLITSAEVLEEAEGLTQVIQSGEPVLPHEVVRYRKDGSPVHVTAAGSPILVDGELIGVVAVYTDISERMRAERLLQALNEAALAVEQALTLDAIFGVVGQEFSKLGFSCAIFAIDEESNLLLPQYVSYATEAVATAEDLIGVKSSEFSFQIDTVDVFRQAVREGQSVLAEGDEAIRAVLPEPLKEFAVQLVQILGIQRSINVPLIVEDMVHGVLSVQSDDLTEGDVPAITAFGHQLAAAWRKAELLQDLEASFEQLKRTQAQFLQAQKMEAVGRLAGGVAHDLNNMLTVIQFSSQLIERQLRPEDPLWEHIWEIKEASDRAAGLTKHLLIFSRREVVEPRTVNLTQVVRNLNQMLRRTIGEDVELVTSLADNLWPTEVDPSQMEQAIVNLVVNARDAMPLGGRLLIETANAELDKAYAARHLDVEPGAHVMLAVSDTGVGMTDEVKAHLFEPFFTTKERGKGTGLGLATVFGIVTRHGGHVSVQSDVGEGTTFRIYLPRTEGEVVRLEKASSIAWDELDSGTETILVVEDDRDVRELATYILQSRGYEVLAAANGMEALQVSEEHEGAIDLLLTDVILPKMNGKELAIRLLAQRPETRVLYMSGHSDDLIARHGVLAKGVKVLSKPFTMDTLLKMTRAQLNAAS
jgi:PAS domain S-box-containing protein